MTGLGLKLPHGPHRRPMGGFAAFPSPETSSEARATMARCPRRVQRDSLGAAHRRSLARSADRYPPYQTCHRRFQQWQRDGTLTRLLHALAEDLRARGKLDLSETFIDASFSSAKKGALLSARLAEVKAVKSWRSQTAMVFPLPATSPALRRMKRNSSKAPSNTV